MKQGLRNIRAKCDSRPSKTDKMHKLLDIIKEMKDFQEILLVAIPHRIFIAQKSAKKKEETKSEGFFEKTTRLLRNSIGFFQNAIEYFKENGAELLDKAQNHFESSQSGSPSLEELPLDMRERISQFFWDRHLEKLNQILHDIPTFQKEDADFQKRKGISLSLRKNILQTVDYRYFHNIITRDGLGNFLKLGETLKIAASNRVITTIQEGFASRVERSVNIVPILNDWHPQIDRRFYEGQFR
jgi:hypothetical protein